MKGKKRHDIAYRTLWFLFRHFLAHKFRFKYDRIKVPQSPYIVIANHLTNWDPILVGLSFGKNMYYVATDQIFRMGFKSKLLLFLFSPIPRAKTIQETQTVITIFRRLKDKCSICIFVEGSSSFDGETCEIQPSIGKLIKRAGVSLVTYRFTGSYFTLPRWARFIRKGKMEGRLVQIYSPQDIASMSENEIYEIIKKDINASAYTEQEKNPVVFRGKKRAEYLETILYCCPKCKQFSTLTSCDDMLSCPCGFQVRYNELCYFEIPGKDEQPPFRTITDWTEWQKKEIIALAKSKKDTEPLLEDDNQYLFEVERAKKNTFITKGKLCMYKEKLSITDSSGATREFPFETVNDISAFAMMRIIFSTNENKIFEVHSKHPRSALKYLDMYKAIKSLT
jgi:1-acyl-sn-glycerol-3-phosphate acyltransferase